MRGAIVRYHRPTTEIAGDCVGIANAEQLGEGGACGGSVPDHAKSLESDRMSITEGLKIGLASIFDRLFSFYSISLATNPGGADQDVGRAQDGASRNRG
jgi:hypothetical protein